MPLLRSKGVRKNHSTLNSQITLLPFCRKFRAIYREIL